MGTSNISNATAVFVLLLASSATVHAGPYVNAVLADNPVGYWRLEEGTGTAVDSAVGSEGSQDGTYVDSPATVAGPIASESSNIAANFAGNQGYVDIPDLNGVFSTYVDPVFGGSPWSMEFWINNGAGGDPFVKGAHCCGTYFHHNGAGTTLRFGILSAGPPKAVDFNDAPSGAGIWTHVVGIISDVDGFNTDARVYVNGVLVPESDVVFPNVPDDDTDLFREPLTIGALALDGGTYGNFFSGAIDEAAVYDYALDDPNESGARDNTRIMAHYLASGFVPPADGTYIAGASGNWHNERGWVGGIPDANDVPALFGDSVGAPATVFTETNVTVPAVTFANENEHVIMGNGGITLDATAGTAAIDVQLGSHQFQLPVTLADATTVNAEPGTTLTFNGKVNLGANDLTTQGGGTVVFNNNVSSDGGMLVLNGSILGGSGNIEADVDVNGGGLAVQQDGLTVSGNVSIAGPLEVTLLDGFDPLPGETFDILTAVDIDIEDLDLLVAKNSVYGLVVIDNAFGGETLQLTIVPEPAGCFLVFLALAGSLFMRTKSSRVVVPLLFVTLLTIGTSQPLQAGVYENAVLADNPAGYWRLEEGTGVAADSSSVQGTNNGEYVGGIQKIPGALGPLVETSNSAISINNTGTNAATDYIRVPDTFTGGAMASVDLTFEAWLKPAFSTTGEFGDCCGNWMERGYFSAGGATFAQQAGDRIHAGRNAGAPTKVGPIEANVWTHVVVTYDGDVDANTTTQTIYFNGALAAEAGTTNPFTPSNVPHDDSDTDLVIGLLAFGPPEDAFNNLIQAWHGGIDEVAYYDHVLSAERVGAHFAASGGIIPDPGAWTSTDSGNWKNAGNWIFQDIPDTNEEMAILGAAIGQPRSIYLESDVVVKGVKFDNANEYAIGGNGVVVLASADTSTLEVLQGSHQFQGAVQTTAPTTATIEADSALTFNGPLSLSSVLTKEGPGTLHVNNRDNTGGGSGIVVNAGTLGGSGEVDGNLTNNSGGTVAPGASPGILTVDGSYTQASGGTLEIELGGLTAGQQHDQLNVLGSLDLDGTLMISLIDDFSPVDGNTFDIFNFTNATLQAGLDIQLPAGDWDTSMLGSTGELIFGDGPVGADGDFNLSGLVDAQDLNLALFNWNKNGSELPTEWLHMRPADNVAVGVAELNKVLFTWNQTGGSLAAAVPEPTTTVLFAVGMLGCLVTFRRAR